MTRRDIITFTLAWYNEPAWGRIRLGPGRWSMNAWRVSVIIEMWWIR